MESEEVQNAIYATSVLTTADGTTVWLAASISGLVRSTDAGSTWHDAYASLNPQAPITTICIGGSPSFAADHYVLSGAIDGILVSQDAGVTWSALELPPPPPAVSSFVFSPTFDQDGFVFAGTLEDGIYRSGNRGTKWDAWNFGLMDLNVLDLAISPEFAVDETLFAATESGIFRSTNGGRAWEDLAFPSDLAPVISIATLPVSGANHTLFAGTESCGLLRSTDGGDSWSQLADGDIEGAVNAMVFSPDYAANPQILALANDAVVLSSDGGGSWSDMQLEPAPRASITSMAPITPIGPSMQLLLGLMDGTVVTSRASVDTTNN